MNKCIIVATLLVLSYHGSSQKNLAFVQTPIDFVIKNAGFNINGTFSGLEGLITVSTQNAEPIKMEGTIDANTIVTGISIRDSHLKKADYFDVKKFPKIYMSSTQIKKISGNKYVGNFDVTIKDIKKAISIPFSYSTMDNDYRLNAEFSINRLDFKLGEESVVLSDDVKIKIKLRTVSK